MSIPPMDSPPSVRPEVMPPRRRSLFLFASCVAGLKKSAEEIKDGKIGAFALAAAGKEEEEEEEEEGGRPWPGGKERRGRK